MVLKDAAREFQRGTLDNYNMDKMEFTASNFMPRDLLEIICILEKGEKCHSYKIIRKRNSLTLVTKFPAKNGEWTPLKNNASGRQTASHHDKKEFLPKKSCQKESGSVERTNHQLVLLTSVRIRKLKILPM